MTGYYEHNDKFQVPLSRCIEAEDLELLIFEYFFTFLKQKYSLV